jgi:predicted phage tail protein
VSQVYVERIIRYQGPANDWRRVSTLSGGQTRYDDPDVVAGTTYRYRVMACNIDGCSPWAASPDVVGPGVVGLPLSPSSLNTRSYSSSTISLEWPATANATRFTLSRRRLNADGTWSGWTGVVALGAQATSHTDTGLEQGTYHYRLRACNVAGCSDYRGSSVTVTFPAAPTAVRATATSPSTVRLTWTDMSSTETHSTISRRTSTVTVLVATLPANATRYDDASLTPGTAYLYRIRVCNASGCTPNVSAPQVTTPAQ